MIVFAIPSLKHNLKGIVANEGLCIEIPLHQKIVERLKEHL